MMIKNKVGVMAPTLKLKIKRNKNRPINKKTEKIIKTLNTFVKKKQKKTCG